MYTILLEGNYMHKIVGSDKKTVERWQKHAFDPKSYLNDVNLFGRKIERIHHLQMRLLPTIQRQNGTLSSHSVSQRAD